MFETRIREFICRMLRAYLEERNIKEVLSYLDEEVEWIGTGELEMGHGHFEAGEFLEQEYKRFPGSFFIIEENYKVRALDGQTATVFGELSVQERGKEKIFESQKMRMTVVCREKEGKIKILQVHMSAGSPNQLENEFFPRTIQEQNTGKLIRLLDEQEVLLREQNENLNALMENVPGGVMCCEFNDELTLLQYSQGFLNLFGYTRDEIERDFHNQFRPLIYPEDLEATWQSVREQLARGSTKKIEYRARCKDGGLITILDHGQLVERKGKEVFYCILTDVTENRKILEKLHLSLERHQIIMGLTNDIIFEWDMSDNQIFFSDNWMKLFGYYPNIRDVNTETLQNYIYPDDFRAVTDALENLRNHIPVKEIEIRIAKADGTYIWCRLRSALQESGEQGRIKAIGVISDIDRERRNTDMLMEKSQRDALTGLYNKTATAELGGEYIGNASETAPCAFIMLDLDNFKYINDVFGHLSGDVLLSDIALLLKRIFRTGDIIGRIGGDEFVIIIPGTGCQNVIQEKFDQIKEGMEACLKKNGYMLSCSAGAAFAPFDGNSFQKLYKNADSALYNAKERGKNQLAFYCLIQEKKEKTNARGGKFFCGKQRDGEGHQELTLAEYVLTVLYQEEDKSKAISQVLEIVGRQLGVSRVYIFEDSEDQATCANTFEWCNEGVEPQKEFLQEVEYTKQNKYEQLFDENGLFYCSDIDRLDERTEKLMASQDIVSMLQCLVVDKGVKKGFLGFDQCREKRMWRLEEINSLSMVSKVVGVFLTQLRMDRQLQKLLTEQRTDCSQSGTEIH